MQHFFDEFHADVVLEVLICIEFCPVDFGEENLEGSVYFNGPIHRESLGKESVEMGMDESPGEVFCRSMR